MHYVISRCGTACASHRSRGATTDDEFASVLNTLLWTRASTMLDLEIPAL